MAWKWSAFSRCKFSRQHIKIQPNYLYWKTEFITSQPQHDAHVNNSINRYHVIPYMGVLLTTHANFKCQLGLHLSTNSPGDHLKMLSSLVRALKLSHGKPDWSRVRKTTLRGVVQIHPCWQNSFLYSHHADIKCQSYAVCHKVVTPYIKSNLTKFNRLQNRIHKCLHQHSDLDLIFHMRIFLWYKLQYHENIPVLTSEYNVFIYSEV